MASAKVFTICRSRSGLADARFSSNRAANGRLSGAVIVLFSFKSLVVLEGSAGGRLTFRLLTQLRDQIPDLGGNLYTTSLDATAGGIWGSMKQRRTST